MMINIQRHLLGESSSCPVDGVATNFLPCNRWHKILKSDQSVTKFNLMLKHANVLDKLKHMLKVGITLNTGMMVQWYFVYNCELTCLISTVGELVL